MTSPLRRAARRVTGAIAEHLGRSEPGITFVLFALAIVVILGMVAVGIDGGRLFDERRRAQNAADHAAVTAAHAFCILPSTKGDLAASIAAGEASADTNGYDGGSTNDVTIANPSGRMFVATIDTTIPATFSHIIGWSQLDTGATATAECQGGSTGSAPGPIYAGGTNCPGGSSYNTIEISGNYTIVTGLTHTNGSFENHGNDSSFTNTGGPAVEFVTTFNGHPEKNNDYVEAEDDLDAVPDPQWPPGFDPIINMNPTMWNAYKAANVLGSNITDDEFDIAAAGGVYYTENPSGVTVKSIADGASFTVVSRVGPIRFGDEYSGKTFHANGSPPANTPQGVIVVTGYDAADAGGKRCDNPAVERSGKGGTWNGTWWAPNAGVRFAGNENIVNGSLVAWSVHLNGNQNEFHGGAGGAFSDPDIVLLQ